MRVYLDANVILREHDPDFIVSDFAAAEFSSVIAKRVRTRLLTADEARGAFVAFDTRTARASRRAATTTAEVEMAEAFVRRLELPLRAPDALNIAIAMREAAAVATFDVQMASAARAVGAAVAPA